MAGRLAAASILCYLIFLAPLICRIAGFESPSMGYLLLVTIAPAFLSAISSFLIVKRGLCFAPPIIGGVAALASNYASDQLLAIASEAYLTWQFLIAIILAPSLSAGLFMLAKPEKIPEVEIEEVKDVEEREAVEEPKNVEAGMELISCPYCGGSIPADSIYCPLCGERIRER